MNARGKEGSVFSRTKPTILLTGLVMVVLGVAVLIHPLDAIATLVRIVGWILVAYGIVTAVTTVIRGNPLQDSPAELALGVIAVIFGLIMGIFPEPLVKIAWTLIGIVVLMTGVLDVIEAGDFRRVGSPLALPATISGVITVFLGLLVIFMPLFMAELSIVFAALALVVDGVTEIIFGLGA